MAKSDVDFNQSFFDNIMKSAKVQEVVKQKAEQALKVAQATAPVDTGEYRGSMTVEKHSSRYRDSFRVEAKDPKSLIIESKTGNLARALKGVKG